MKTILTLIPDVEVFLTLSTEELAFSILLLANEHKQNNIVHHQVIIDQVNGAPAFSNCYPQNKRVDVELAFAEAWNWLMVQGLLIKDLGVNGNNGYVRLSRRAKSILTKDKFNNYTKGMAFPRHLLHPSIAEDVWLDFVRGDHEIAIFRAFKMVEVAVREASKLDDKDFGTNLMRKAFDKTSGVLSNFEDPESEREALAHLFAGAIGVYKNPQSHRVHKIKTEVEAQEMVMLASHLLRIVDNRVNIN